MSLEIIAGSSGAGKSYTVYRELIGEAIAHPEKQFLVIVPEQFTMQAQKEIVRMHPRHGLLNVDILSFHRLAWRVFEEVGGNTLPILEETGKTLIVQRMIAQHRKEMQVLGRTLSRQGAVAQMKSLISEFLQYGIRPEDLQVLQEAQPESLLTRKLDDIRILYLAFRNYLETRFLATEEVPEVLCRVIHKSKRLRNCVVCLDGFTGFTPLQQHVLQELFLLAESVKVLVTMEPVANPFCKLDAHQLFHMSTEMTRSLSDLAAQCGTETLPVRWIEAGEKSRFSGSPSLQFLEQHLFRYHKDTFEKKPESIFLYEAADPRQELRHVAAEILRQVRRGGRHYKDFAILTGDLETYGEEAAGLFEAEGIPCFLDRRRSVMSNVLVEAIRATLQMVAKSYSYESVIRYLRSGISHLTQEEIDAFENYVLALGIRGRKRYEETWTRLPKYLAPEKIVPLNALRERFIEETKELHEALHDRKGNVQTKTDALRAFLVRQQAAEKIEALQAELLEQNKAVQAKEYEQIPDAVQDLLEKVRTILGEEKSGVAAYADLLDAGFEEVSIGTIPPGEDQVMIGDIERTRLKKIEVLFFVGINEGIIPRPAGGSGVLSEIDREKLREAKIDLAPTPREEITRQRFYLYLAMTKPSHALHLSYARTNKKAEAQMPSYLIGMLRRLFPALPLKRQEEEHEEGWETAAGRKMQLLQALQKRPEEHWPDAVKELLLWMRNDPEEKEKLGQLLAASAGRKNEDSIGRRLAEKIYGRELVGSATRLEKFAHCAFRHFCDFGLHLQEREVYSFSMADLGSVMHAALEAYALLLRSEGKSWRGLPEETRTAYADRALEEVVTGFGNDILHSSGRNNFRIEQIRTVLHRTVWALQEQIEHGAFDPADFEFQFYEGMESAHLSLSGEAALRLTGRVDRVDLCEQGDTTYVKIIDYKTGNTTFDLNQLVHGLQLQLFLYLQAVLDSEQKKNPGRQVEPAGAFYYHIDDPVLSDEDDGSGDLPQEKIEEKILEKLRPNGRCRAEEEVYTLMDSELEGAGGRSRVLPIEIKKDGDLTKASQAADRETFALMRTYTTKKALDLGERILAGETAARPSLYKEQSACDYCLYCSVCGFDPRLPGHRYRQIYKKEEDELLFQMKEELTPSEE